MILTAKQLAEVIDDEFYKEHHYYWSETEPLNFATEVALQFTKLHVEEALKTAKDSAGYTTKRDRYRNITEVTIDGDSILNAYPLENIK